MVVLRGTTCRRWRVLAAVLYCLRRILAPLLQFAGNPPNMGICVACLERDIAGVLWLHRAAVVLVYSASYAIRAEKPLHMTGIQSKLIPVPRHLSSNCGVCVWIAQSDREAARQVLQQASMEIDGVHDI